MEYTNITTKDNKYSDLHTLLSLDSLEEKVSILTTEVNNLTAIVNSILDMLKETEIR